MQPESLPSKSVLERFCDRTCVFSSELVRALACQTLTQPPARTFDVALFFEELTGIPTVSKEGPISSARSVVLQPDLPSVSASGFSAHVDRMMCLYHWDVCSAVRTELARL